jgi:hypothetical protein
MTQDLAADSSTGKDLAAEVLASIAAGQAASRTIPITNLFDFLL